MTEQVGLKKGYPQSATFFFKRNVGHWQSADLGPDFRKKVPEM